MKNQSRRNKTSHSLELMPVSWLPPYIIKCKDNDADTEWNDGKLFKMKAACYRHFIEVKELCDHPERVRRYPENDGEVMAQLGKKMAGADRNNDGNDERREYHSNSQWFPYKAPTDVFQQPENNVQVLHLTKTDRDTVYGFIPGHGSGFRKLQ
jgi:hypothetical protein